MRTSLRPHVLHLNKNSPQHRTRLLTPRTPGQQTSLDLLHRSISLTDGRDQKIGQGAIGLFEDQVEHFIRVLEIAIERGAENFAGLRDQLYRYAIRAVRGVIRLRIR